jgi:flagellin
MVVSLNTNKAAMQALKNLNSTSDQLQQVQQRVSSGLSVSTAKDNASVYAIAQSQRADLAALNAVTASLNRGSSIADVTLAAGQGVSDLLNQLREKVLGAMDDSISSASRSAMNNDFRSLLAQIKTAVSNAVFDGTNLLNGTVSGGIQFIANAAANSTITLSARDLSLGGANISVTANSTILTVTTATAMLSRVDSSIANVNAQLGQLGSQAKQIQGHLGFVSRLSDALNQGVGNLVDADMARESARLQALQVQQQLGVQSLNIANQSPSTILSLFRNN